MGKLPKGGKARARASAKLNRIKGQKSIVWKNKLVNNILKWDAPELGRLCSPVEKTDDLSFIKTLRSTLLATKNGLGLAASQIGILKNVFVYRKKVADISVVLVMINPIIVKSGKTTATAHEGCLSFPGFVAQIERPTSITINWKDENWNDNSETFGGLLAIVVSHEIDHFYGRLIWNKNIENSKDKKEENAIQHE